MDNCEHEIPCKSALREPWCRPCLLGLVGQQNDLNERLNADIERLVGRIKQLEAVYGAGFFLRDHLGSLEESDCCGRDVKRFLDAMASAEATDPALT